MTGGAAPAPTSQALDEALTKAQALLNDLEFREHALELREQAALDEQAKVALEQARRSQPEAAPPAASAGTIASESPAPTTHATPASGLLDASSTVAPAEASIPAAPPAARAATEPVIELVAQAAGTSAGDHNLALVVAPAEPASVDAPAPQVAAAPAPEPRPEPPPPMANKPVQASTQAYRSTHSGQTFEWTHSRASVWFPADRAELSADQKSFLRIFARYYYNSGASPVLYLCGHRGAGSEETAAGIEDQRVDAVRAALDAAGVASTYVRDCHHAQPDVAAGEVDDPAYARRADVRVDAPAAAAAVVAKVN
jgi:hypothetical protein